MPAGAPYGNTNPAKGATWNDAIRRAIARARGKGTRDALDKAADKLVAAAMAGDEWAIKELGNRIDGKSVQGVIDYTPPPVNPPTFNFNFNRGGPGVQPGPDGATAPDTDPKRP